MEYLVNDTDLEAVADAIREKGGTSKSLEFPGDFVTAIEDIQTGGGGNIYDDVVFWDSLANGGNGGVVYSYSASDFLALTAMPANPDHSDFETHGIEIPMTSQGWNWSLADAKTYVQSYGKLHIGQMYIPTDGKSHWICYVPLDAPVERWNTEIQISVEGGDVNWQIDDGTTSTASGDISVTFPSVGWHDVKISAPSGVIYRPYRSEIDIPDETTGKIQKIIQVFIGNGATSIGLYAFRGYRNLTSITIPDTVTNIDNSAFGYCCMTTVTIPDGVTSIGNNAFFDCRILKSVTIPDTVTTIGNGVFSNCGGIKSITIPDTVTSIDYSMFSSCYAMTSITIPDTITSIVNGMFSYCYSLKSIAIPDTVTSIGNSSFSYCRSLTTVTIPNAVTNIGNNVFLYCFGLKNIIMENSTPPTLSSSSSFSGLLSDYSIIVPAGSLSAYTSAEKWSNVADHIVEAT